MNPKQALVERICQTEKADGVVLVIFHAGMDRAEFVSAAAEGFDAVLPEKLEKLAKQCGEQFAALKGKVN